MKKLLVLLATTLLLAVGLLSSANAAPPAGAQQASPHRAPEARKASEPLQQWHCGKFVGTSTTSSRYCARLTKIDDDVRIDYRERFQNTGDGNGTLHCSYQETTTWTESVSVTGKVEAGVIFAKVETSATAGIQHATSTTKTASVDYTQKPHSWAYCERGIHGFTFTGTVRRQVCSSQACTYDHVRSFRGSAPSAGFWRYGDGRGGVEITPRG